MDRWIKILKNIYIIQNSKTNSLIAKPIVYSKVISVPNWNFQDKFVLVEFDYPTEIFYARQ